MKRIAVFASGSGTNAENLIHYFRNSQIAEIAVVFCNRRGAGVIRRSENLKVPVVVFDKVQLYDSDGVILRLQAYKIDMIVLAGFLWLIPPPILNLYPGSVINIHPALLPKYGGKGMYGQKVHQAVIDNREEKSGITIHLIDEDYDKGQNLAQIECQVKPEDTAETLAHRIHALEYEFFPRVIEKFIKEGQE
jgi:phosphoribosylglycinamide formyltransferase-1